MASLHAIWASPNQKSWLRLILYLLIAHLKWCVTSFSNTFQEQIKLKICENLRTATIQNSLVVMKWKTM